MRTQSSTTGGLDNPHDEAGLIESVQLEPSGEPSPASREVLDRNIIGGALMTIGIVIAILVLMRSGRKARLRARARGDLTPKERLNEIRTTAAKDGVHELHAARAADVARRYAAQMDNRIEYLEQLLSEADERIARLESMQAGGAAPEQATEAPGPTGPVLAAETAPARETEAPADPFRARVCELADEGLATVEIARQLGTHTGKVELILALRNAAG